MSLPFTRDEDAPPGEQVWADALWAARLFAVDPGGLGGVAVRSAAGPVRDHWFESVRGLLPAGAPLRRFPPHIEDDRLLGGLDLAASLARGAPVAQRGLLAEADGGVAIAAMAERMSEATAARIAVALDAGEIIVARDGLEMRHAARLGLIALDEGAAPEERPPAALLERLAIHLELDGISVREAVDEDLASGAVTAARARLAEVAAPGEAIVEALCETAAALGIGSVRAPMLALRVARASAALAGRREIGLDDAVLAARLVLAPRARIVPAEPQDAPAPPEPDARDDGGATSSEPNKEQDQLSETPSPTEVLVAATRTALPKDLLAQLVQATTRQTRTPPGRGAGAAAASLRRGRPIGSRGGPLRAGARLDLVATLRAAAPWQRLRSGGPDVGEANSPPRIAVRREDFRIRRFVQRSEATTIFVVDASGSSAFQRLGEAKGAVEMLLAGAYVTRTRVALIAFRQASAETLLPPTRSLARAKRRLAELPGGGGTPLAAGIDAALALAQAERAKGRTPTLVLLTDGRANVARDGGSGRERAQDDALASARAVRASAVQVLFVDTSRRPRPDGDRLAREMAAAYAPLPFLAPEALVDSLRDLGAAT